jgi:hypothetical protein
VQLVHLSCGGGVEFSRRTDEGTADREDIVRVSISDRAVVTCSYDL